ncbi:trypsin-like serine peptidase [Phytohabitans sp. LJ34]|uniref:trypsin-like serine peptidase n=1 Tax=Phytohabitans sp. LJ34 TaxID=3452217 RepID=UPI003F8A6E91
MTVAANRVGRSTWVAIALVPVLALGQPASAAPAPGAGFDPGATAAAWAAGRAAFGPTATEHQAIVAYWTPARMRAAKPAEELPAYREAVRRYVDSGPAHRPAEAGAPATFPPAAGSDPDLAPHHPTARTSGKVFGSNPEGLDFICSGTVVNSEGKDTVWTAGHCADGQAGNWAFVPGFDDDLADPRPFGTWTASRLFAAPGWLASGDLTEDMGVAVMNTLDGAHIVTRLGGQGFTVNRGRFVRVDAFGYPAEPPFDGGDLRRCHGISSPDSSGETPPGQRIEIPCDMTRGSSGGGWLMDWDGRFGLLYGVNSRIDRLVDPTIMITPYFDGTALRLYNRTRRL